MATNLTRKELDAIDRKKLAEAILKVYYALPDAPRSNQGINLVPLEIELRDRLVEETATNRLDRKDVSILDSKTQAIEVHARDIAQMYCEQVAADEDW